MTPITKKCVCGQEITFAMGPNGKPIPLENRTQVYGIDSRGHALPVPDVYVNHYRTCPRANEFGRTGATMKELRDLLEEAWGVIANSWRGNWSTAPLEWQEAAARWRDKWFASLPKKGGPGREEQAPPVV